MTYRLQVDESVRDGIRRVIDEQINSAIENLSERDEDIEKSIHETRKCFKKIRAVLRLCRNELYAVYSDENQWFRDAGRRLSGYRDITATLEALGKLRETMEEDVDAVVFDEAANFLQQKRLQITQENSQVAEEMKSLVADLKKKQQEIEILPLYAADDFNALKDGLRRTYKRG
ncbi:MAG: CHAD domain-containing protein, partial [Verrucomicrobiota bacterium]